MVLTAVCLAMLGVPAQAAFPGRDGRILWVEGMASGSDRPEVAGDSFYVNQVLAAGEPPRREGSMQCSDSPEPDLADGERLCPFFRPTFSPDGRTIAVGVKRALRENEYAAPRRNNLALEEANSRFRDGERLPDVTEDDREPAWSPDGRRLVFVGLVAGLTDLYTVTRDGSDLRRLTADGSSERRPVWSTRGQIAFERDGGIWAVRTDGSGLRRLARRGRDPDWSPGGSRLVFERDRRLYTVSRTGRRLRRLVGTGTYPAWSPSGRWIAFRRKYDIYIARANGTRSRRVYDWVRFPGSSPRRRYAPRDINWGPKQR